MGIKPSSKFPSLNVLQMQITGATTKNPVTESLQNERWEMLAQKCTRKPSVLKVRGKISRRTIPVALDGRYITELRTQSLCLLCPRVANTQEDGKSLDSECFSVLFCLEYAKQLSQRTGAESQSQCRVLLPEGGFEGRVYQD